MLLIFPCLCIEAKKASKRALYLQIRMEKQISQYDTMLAFVNTAKIRELQIALKLNFAYKNLEYN